MSNLSRDHVKEILGEYRPDVEDWAGADLLTVLGWLLPQEWKRAEERLREGTT